MENKEHSANKNINISDFNAIHNLVFDFAMS